MAAKSRQQKGFDTKEKAVKKYDLEKIAQMNEDQFKAEQKRLEKEVGLGETEPPKLSVSLRADSSMPKTMDGRFFGLKYSAIQITEEDTERMKESFVKFLPENAPGDNHDLLDPKYLREKYL